MLVTVAPLNTFLNFIIGKTMKIIISPRRNDGIDICSDGNLADSEYADGVALLGEDPNELQVFLNRLNDGVGMFGMRLARSKNKVLF